MSEKISRRNFLRTATLGAAAAGLLAGCGNSAASGKMCIRDRYNTPQILLFST